MQYFLGYPSFSDQAPFDSSLMTDFRKRLGMDQVNAINERIVTLKAKFESQQDLASQPEDKDSSEDKDQDPDNKGRLIVDATACPQDIAYPTDLDLLSGAREKAEQLIDKIYDLQFHKKKPRTYRQVARKRYLQTAQKKNKSRKLYARLLAAS